MPKILKPEQSEGFIMHQSAKIETENGMKLYPEYAKYLKEKDSQKTKSAQDWATVITDMSEQATLKQNAILLELKKNEEKKIVQPPNKKVLYSKEGQEKLQAKEYDLVISQLSELIKENKIDQIIVAGEKIPEPQAIRLNPKSKEKTLALTPDLDAKTTLYLLNNYSNRSLQDTYSDNSRSSIIGKGGGGLDTTDQSISKEFKKINSQELENKDQKNKIKVFIDVGGKWPSIKTENNGETTTLYLDHHGAGQREATSGTKIMLDVMKQAGILKDLPPWFNKFIDFVNDIDNLSYLKKEDTKGQKIFDENYFRNEWPNSLYALAEKHIPFDMLIAMAEKQTITDFDRPFTKEELEGKIGQTKIGELTIKELCQKQKIEVVDTLENGIKNSISNNKKEGLNLEKTRLGKIIYHNYFIKKNRRANVIPNYLAFKATKAKGYDTYISFDKQNKKAFINSFSPNLSSIVEKLNETDPGCAIDIRGVMVSVKFDKMTEEQFLNIIDPNILKNKKEITTKLPELLELGWSEEEAQKELDGTIKQIEESEKRLIEIEKELAKFDDDNTNKKT